MPDNKKGMGNDAQQRNRKIKKIERIEVKANKTDNEDKLSKKSKAWRIIRPILGIFIALTVVSTSLILVFNYGYNHYFAPVDPDGKETVKVTIESGSNLSAISDVLEENGIIRNSTVFKLYVDFSDMSSKLLAGTFELSPSMGFDEIISVLKRPTSINNTMDMQFIEGTTVEQMAKKTVKDGLFASDDEYLKEAKTGEAFANYDFIQDVIVANGKSEQKREYVLEGYLFPDKYNVFTKTTPQDVIEKQLTKFDQVFNDEYKQRAKELGMTVDQVVTLASILEKEGTGDDFDKISAVFHNRLNQNMPLQSDATIMYVLKENRLIVTTEDTSIDSPYNTYRNTGLPIGPICNPSEAAIKAALYPDEDMMNDGYLYFCLGDPETGEVIYSKTLAEHEAVQEKYKEKWAEYDKKNAAAKE